jgi:hypothetical protein
MLGCLVGQDGACISATRSHVLSHVCTVLGFGQQHHGIGWVVPEPAQKDEPASVYNCAIRLKALFDAHWAEGAVELLRDLGRELAKGKWGEMEAKKAEQRENAALEHQATNKRKSQLPELESTNKQGAEERAQGRGAHAGRGAGVGVNSVAKVPKAIIGSAAHAAL